MRSLRHTGKAKRTRIAMVVHAYYERDARVRRYAEALAETGWEVDVFCLRDRGEARRQRKKGVDIIRVPITRARGSKLRYFLEYVSSFLLFTTYMTIFHLQRRYRLVHVHSFPDVLVFTACLPKLMGAKVVLDFHDPMPELYMSKYKMTRENKAIKVIKFLECLSARHADLLITANKAFKRIFLSRGLPAEKLYVINNLADPTLFRFQEEHRHKSNKSFVLLYVGTISERYGLDVAIRALPALRQAIPGVEFRIFGKITREGSDLDRLQSLAQELGVLDLVKFNGPIPLEKVADEMAEADVGVYTPVHDLHMDYALSLKVPEFVAMKVPVVATCTPVMEEYLGPDGAAYIEAGDVAGFVGQVINLYRDSELRQRIQRSYESFLSHYSWDVEKRKYLDLVAGQVRSLCKEREP